MLPQALIQEFKSRVGEDDVFADPADLLTYSYEVQNCKVLIVF
jgi:hypothetical protein